MSKPARSWPPIQTESAVPHPDAPPPGSKLGAHYAHCFGCGDQVESGLRIRSTVGKDMVVVSQFTVTDVHQGAPGLAHGGLLACAFDEALGGAVGHLLRQPAVTGKLETDFRRPVPVGSTLHILAKLDGVAGRKIYVSADGHLDAEDGPLAVQARALFVTVGVEHFTTHGDRQAWKKFRDLRLQREPGTWDINP